MVPYIIVCTLLIILIICYYCFSPQNTTTKKIATRACGCTKRSITRLPSKFIDIVTDPSDYYFTYTWNISSNTVVYTPYQDYRLIVRLNKTNSNVTTSTQIINSNNVNIVPTLDANQTDFTLIYRKSEITPTTTYLDLLREIIITTTGNLSGSYIQIFDGSQELEVLLSQSDIIMGGNNRDIIKWSLTNNLLTYYINSINLASNLFIKDNLPTFVRNNSLNGISSLARCGADSYSSTASNVFDVNCDPGYILTDLETQYFWPYTTMRRGSRDPTIILNYAWVGLQALRGKCRNVYNNNDVKYTRWVGNVVNTMTTTSSGVPNLYGGQYNNGAERNSGFQNASIRARNDIEQITLSDINNNGDTYLYTPVFNASLDIEPGVCTSNYYDNTTQYDCKYGNKIVGFRATLNPSYGGTSFINPLPTQIVKLGFNCSNLEPNIQQNS